jgi:hypothetical protein
MATSPDGTETKDAQSRPPDDALALSESLEDARVLLWYATREGKQLPEDMVQTIVDAQSLLGPGRHDPGLECRFLVAFRALAAAMRPVTVDSIEATYGYPFGNRSAQSRRRLGNAVKTKRRYSVAALIVLSLLLITQIYWFVGTAVRTDLERNREELDRISGAIREMDFRNTTLNELIDVKTKGAVNASSTPVGIGFELMNELKTMKEQRNQIYLDFINNKRRSERVNMILAGDECLLGWWNVVDAMVFRPTGAAGAAGEGHSDPASLGNQDPCARLQQNLQPIGEIGSIPQQDLYGRHKEAGSTNGGASQSDSFQKSLDDVYAKIVVHEQSVELSLESSKSILAILNQYILPLLYGALGSLAYTLRSLSTEIHNVTFTRGSDIRYSLRWPLGMLGGVTVGLFFDPANLSGLAAITPLGLAFLAGYGVELVFTGLDKLVRAFTSDEGRGSKPA